MRFLNSIDNLGSSCLMASIRFLLLGKLSNGAVVGEIIGLTINGYVSEKFGYRYTVLACLAMITGFIAIFFTATTVEQLQVGEILCGIVSCSP